MQPCDNYLVNLIKFRGIALKYIEADKAGAPYGWTVNVTGLISGSQPCNEVNVTLQAVSPPKGYMDDNITAGDEVEVYGEYVEDSCNVSLIGSEDYYIKKITGPPQVAGKQPKDNDGDDLYEDVDGSDSFNFGDVIFFFQNFESSSITENEKYYDFNGDGGINFGDVIGLFNNL